MANTEDRCYYCKKNVLSVVKNAAEQANLEVLLDGSLMKEEGMQYEKLCNSPGGKALAELGIVCLLRLCGVTRSQVRDLLKFRGMNDFIQPENACLATRIAVGEPITIKSCAGFAQRKTTYLLWGMKWYVRVQEQNARIEVAKEQVPMLLEQKESVIEELKGDGFPSGGDRRRGI